MTLLKGLRDREGSRLPPPLRGEGTLGQGSAQTDATERTDVIR